MTTSATTPAPTAPNYGELLDLSVLSPREQAFDKFIERVIIGQPRGKKAAKRAFRRIQSKLRTGRTPVYAILELGPTTCGKSEIPARLAEFLHGNRHAVLKLDGSEYMTESRLTHLIGGTAQWTGFVDKSRADYVPPRADEKDQMCELNNHNLAWSRKGSSCPITIVLVDEWDKACLEFNNIMLSILRDGYYTLGNGEVVDFSNCIFVFTANLGAKDVERAVEKAKNPLGFNKGSEELSAEDIEAEFTKHLKEFTAPEFRARIVENGEIVIFDKLTPEQIAQVRDLKIDEMTAHIAKEVGVTLTVDDYARKILLAMSLANDGTVANLSGVLKTQITDNIDTLLIVKAIADKDNVLVTVSQDGKGIGMKREIKPLLLVGLDSDEYRQATAEADARFAAAGKPGKDEVDVEAVRRAGEQVKRAAAQQPKVRQPFIVTVVTNSPEMLAKALMDLDAAFAQLGITKRSQNTQFGAMIQTEMGVGQGDLTEVKVSADLIDMLKFREMAPGVLIRTVETQL
jgi:hypothetical protein